MAASNDLRGWVMSAVSGLACVLGSSVICVDLFLRHFSHHKNFQIVSHNGFLSASMCLSAGVILFTSLYSMLPTAHEYFLRAGWSASLAAYSLVGLFLAGVIVIRLVSAFIHRYIPSHVVDCAHTHDPSPSDLEHGNHHRHEHHHPRPTEPYPRSTERSPLLTRSCKSTPAVPLLHPENEVETPPYRSEPWRVRLARRWNRWMGGVKAQCDENGPCYGFSQACGRECSKTLVVAEIPASDDLEAAPLIPDSTNIPVRFESRQADSDTPQPGLNTPSSSSSHTSVPDYQNAPTDDAAKPALPSANTQHHHHVPQNAFLSIGLQTSVAIALHKLPEGFITYATNHASPTLGLTVFLALFIHNISEGFAMALPLYLALHSRAKAMFWSSLLGGISQPAGAGLAALWIWGAQHAGRSGDDSSDPPWAVYGGMFAATAGVMTSVGLQLFSEGLGLTHRRGLGIGFAIGGMGLMGLSFALTA
ncbi:Zinc/iron permease [Aspergillus ambiguus]|uniref:Zn(2+) transporter ZRT3 n=1 Tax=Aspergillus ambiguus TaxID=176160 RepID=UPI003CCD85F1